MVLLKEKNRVERSFLGDAEAIDGKNTKNF